MSSSSLTNIIPSNEHIMLLYSSDDERNKAAVNYINDGLKSGYQCIYASINAYDSKSSSNISNLSSSIDNYKENIERDELRIVDFKPYYESALNVDFRPFKKLKKELEETLNYRKSEGKKDAILVFADAACFLSHNKHFEECEILEWWWNETTTEWRQNNQNITVVCPHPGLVLNDPLLSDTKGHLNGKHTITIDLKQSHENQKRKSKRILIAEPNSDIRVLYSLFTKQHGFSISDVSIVENGNKCLEILLSNTADDDNNNNNNNNNDNDYDIIILDTHLPDISGFEVARKIRDRLPHKKIILTTTHSLDNISHIIDSIGIKSEDVILKPFVFSELFSTLKEPRMSYN
ncbi:MAG TPA: response regulator [Nitrososphaeraceae archaeon]|nr:response regulator [Nitrososphaeraceae archaeon]